MTRLSSIIDKALGCMLILSSLSKAIEPTHALHVIQQTGFSNISQHAILIATITVELIVGIGFMMRRVSVKLRMVLCVQFIYITFILAGTLSYQLGESCGCFGSLIVRPFGGWFLITNGVLECALMLSAFLFHATVAKDHNLRQVSEGVFLGIISVAAFLFIPGQTALITRAIRYYTSSVDSEWSGRVSRGADLRLRTRLGLERTDNYVLVLFDPKCPTCSREAQRWRSLETLMWNKNARVVYVTGADSSEAWKYLVSVGLSDAQIKWDSRYEFFAEGLPWFTPAYLMLTGDGGYFYDDVLQLIELAQSW